MAFRNWREDEPIRSGGRAVLEEEYLRASVRGVFRIDSRAKRIRSASF